MLRPQQIGPGQLTAVPATVRPASEVGTILTDIMPLIMIMMVMMMLMPMFKGMSKGFEG